MRVIVGPEARAEFLEAVAWYGRRSPRSARGFVEDFKDTRTRLGRNPERWPEIRPECRRILFRKYPYALVYSIESDHMFVIAIMHQKREPGYWQDRR